MKNLNKYGYCLFFALAVLAGVQHAVAQGTAFTYQGQLQDSGGPANGIYNLKFSLFAVSSGGSAIAGPITNSSVGVTNGLFTVTIDLGSSAFISGATNWLQIGVESNGVSGFTPLSPRQQLTPVPNAIFAESASNISGTLPSASFTGTYGNALNLSNANNTFTGTFTGNGSGLTNFSGWQLAGNTGTTSANFLGTTDNQSLQFRVAGAQAGVITPASGSPNIVFGPTQNSIGSGTSGASILGGNNNTIGVSDSFAFLGGGNGNMIQPNSTQAVLVGGNNNNIVGGSIESVLVGGTGNTVGSNALYSFLGGGIGNQVLANQGYSSIVGGNQNVIGTAAYQSFIGGGNSDSIQSDHSVVGGGLDNQIQTSDAYSFIGGGIENIIFSGSPQSFIGGGQFNNIQINAANATLAGGDQNLIASGASNSVIGGGFLNIVSNGFATVPGGASNLASGQFSFAAGVMARATNTGAFVWSDAEGTPFVSTNTNSFNVRADGGVRFVTGGAGLSVDGQPVLTNISLAQLPAVLGLITDPGSANFFAGLVAGNASISGIRNTGVGGGALGADTSGFENTASGYNALNSDKAGADNTASGAFALSDDTSGSGNTAVGAGALDANTTGSNNVAVGYQALQENRTDNALVAVGYQALQNNAVTSSFVGSGANTAVGYQALQQNTIGSANTGIGWQALINNTNGYNNTALGFWALLNNTSATQNTGLGAFALENTTTGGNNVANGVGALGGNTTGGNNVAVGVSALGNSTEDTGIVAIGYEALQNDAFTPGFFGSSASVAVGYQALQLTTTGAFNTAIGYQALYNNTSGLENTATGINALIANTTGNQNTAYGSAALSGNTAGSANIGIGSVAGENITTGNNNIDIGNAGNSGDDSTIRIGTPGTQLNTFLTGQVVGNAGLNIDQTGTYGLNNGTVTSNALTFGTGPGGSGEGIASQRTSGANQFDLTFYTGFDPRMTILSDGNVGIGTTSPSSALDVAGTTRTQVLTITGGSDLAEPFKISTVDQPVTEGEVVVIDETNPGQLKLTDQPYDTRVAGVISGANGIHPGIQMQQQGLLEGGKNVALTGRVYVQSDASNGAIRPGDLLTTSATPGYAMKVTDHARAQGAILGKAMTGLSEGKGMVLVLVTLQ